MLKLIDEIFMGFRKCFSRQHTFNWFVVIVVGLMIRSDFLGITSVIRDLGILQSSYVTMIHFFRSTAWDLDELITTWTEIVKTIAPIYKEAGMTVLVGDGVKASKEGRKMRGVKKLHQESENSSKAEYIFGHMFGGIGVLIGDNAKMFCVPLSMKIHDGVKTIRKWDSSDETEGSHVVQMIKNGYAIAKIMGKSLLLLDRYFLSVAALETLAKLNETKATILHIITKAKSSVVAYEKPIEYKGKGRPRKKGDRLKLKDLFDSRKNDFKEATLSLYGKEEKVKYLCVDLLWGQKLYQELRFVLVTYNGMKSILVSTDIELNPITIICLYSYRFKIECLFRAFKQLIGGFRYQFWSKLMPKLNRFAKKGEKHPVENTKSEEAKKLILSTLKAIEGYVMCSIVAMGLLQIISIKFSDEINKSPFRFLRTISNTIVSEETVACFLRKNIISFITKNSGFAISRIIKEKQTEPCFVDIQEAS